VISSVTIRAQKSTAQRCCSSPSPAASGEVGSLNTLVVAHAYGMTVMVASIKGWIVQVMS
jgi:hypothetical protein